VRRVGARAAGPRSSADSATIIWGNKGDTQTRFKGDPRWRGAGGRRERQADGGDSLGWGGGNEDVLKASPTTHQGRKRTAREGCFASATVQCGKTTKPGREGIRVRRQAAGRELFSALRFIMGGPAGGVNVPSPERNAKEERENNLWGADTGPAGMGKRKKYLRQASRATVTTPPSPTNPAPRVPIAGRAVGAATPPPPPHEHTGHRTRHRGPLPAAGRPAPEKRNHPHSTLGMGP